MHARLAQARQSGLLAAPAVMQKPAGSADCIQRATDCWPPVQPLHLMERVIYKAQKPVQDTPAAATSKSTGSAGTQIGSVMSVPSIPARSAQPTSRFPAAGPSSNPPLPAKDAKQRPDSHKSELPETAVPARGPAAAPATPERREATAPMTIAARPSAQGQASVSPKPAHSPRQRLASTAHKSRSPTSTNHSRSQNDSQAGGGGSGNSLSMPGQQQNSDPVVGSWKWCAGCGSTGK